MISIFGICIGAQIYVTGSGSLRCHFVDHVWWRSVFANGFRCRVFAGFIQVTCESECPCRIERVSYRRLLLLPNNSSCSNKRFFVFVNLFRQIPHCCNCITRLHPSLSVSLFACHMSLAHLTSRVSPRHRSAFHVYWIASWPAGGETITL